MLSPCYLRIHQGHTKVVKIYRLKKNFCLVDMPGYGENMPPYYVESVEAYILKRQQYVMFPFNVHLK